MMIWISDRLLESISRLLILCVLFLLLRIYMPSLWESQFWPPFIPSLPAGLAQKIAAEKAAQALLDAQCRWLLIGIASSCWVAIAYVRNFLLPARSDIRTISPSKA